jgi:hypothetical protein
VIEQLLELCNSDNLSLYTLAYLQVMLMPHKKLVNPNSSIEEQVQEYLSKFFRQLHQRYAGAWIDCIVAISPENKERSGVDKSGADDSGKLLTNNNGNETDMGREDHSNYHFFGKEGYLNRDSKLVANDLNPQG